jgi:hypothetical protein
MVTNLQYQAKGKIMKNLFNNITVKTGKLDRRHIQLLLVLLSLVLFALGAGAPGASGDVGL